MEQDPGPGGDLAARGALVAASAEEAVAASPLTVICLVNYDATDSVLRRPAVTDALKGRTVANLSADVPERSRDTGRWAAEHGVGYLDGAIMTPAPTIGSPGGVFLYAGPEPLYGEHRPVLDALGGSHTHLGEDIGRAAAYDVALLDLFWTSMTGYVHALALARAEGSRPGSSRRSRRASRRSSRRCSRSGRGTWTSGRTRARSTRSPRVCRPWSTSCTPPRPTASTRASCAPPRS